MDVVYGGGSGVGGEHGSAHVVGMSAGAGGAGAMVDGCRHPTPTESEHEEGDGQEALAAIPGAAEGGAVGRKHATRMGMGSMPAVGVDGTTLTSPAAAGAGHHHAHVPSSHHLHSHSTTTTTTTTTAAAAAGGGSVSGANTTGSAQQAQHYHHEHSHGHPRHHSAGYHHHHHHHHNTTNTSNQHYQPHFHHSNSHPSLTHSQSRAHAHAIHTQGHAQTPPPPHHSHTGSSATSATVPPHHQHHQHHPSPSSSHHHHHHHQAHMEAHRHHHPNHQHHPAQSTATSFIQVPPQPHSAPLSIQSPSHSPGYEVREHYQHHAHPSQAHQQHPYHHHQQHEQQQQYPYAHHHHHQHSQQHQHHNQHVPHSEWYPEMSTPTIPPLPTPTSASSSSTAPSSLSTTTTANGNSTVAANTTTTATAPHPNPHPDNALAAREHESHTHQHPHHVHAAGSARPAPVNSKKRSASLASSALMSGNTDDTTTVTHSRRPCKKPVKPKSGGADIPIPPPTIVVRSGVEWLCFSYRVKGSVKTYEIRIDIEHVTLDGMDHTFKQKNCVYPRAFCDKTSYTGNRWNYETECNRIGWKFVWLNPVELEGRRGLIQRAVDSYRNRYPQLRSRRVIRQEKMRNGTLRKRQGRPGVGQGHGVVGGGVEHHGTVGEQGLLDPVQRHMGEGGQPQRHHHQHQHIHHPAQAYAHLHPKSDHGQVRTSATRTSTLYPSTLLELQCEDGTQPVRVKLNAQIDQVSLQDLPEHFLRQNCIFPDSLPLGSPPANSEERETNIIGFKLAYLNREVLENNVPLLRHAAETYRVQVPMAARASAPAAVIEEGTPTSAAAAVAAAGQVGTRVEVEREFMGYVTGEAQAAGGSLLPPAAAGGSSHTPGPSAYMRPHHHHPHPHHHPHHHNGPTHTHCRAHAHSHTGTTPVATNPTPAATTPPGTATPPANTTPTTPSLSLDQQHPHSHAGHHHHHNQHQTHYNSHPHHNNPTSAVANTRDPLVPRTLPSLESVAGHLSFPSFSMRSHPAPAQQHHASWSDLHIPAAAPVGVGFDQAQVPLAVAAAVAAAAQGQPSPYAGPHATPGPPPAAPPPPPPPPPPTSQTALGGSCSPPSQGFPGPSQHQLQQQPQQLPPTQPPSLQRARCSPPLPSSESSCSSKVPLPPAAATSTVQGYHS